MFERWKRKRFQQRLEAALTRLDRDRRDAIRRLPDDIIIEGLESGYQHSGNKVRHTVDLLVISALLHTCLRTE